MEKEKLEGMRHSCEHVLTMAMMRLWPGKIKAAMGPATEDGFYFDFDADLKISEDDFPKIEEAMRAIVLEDLPILKDEMTVEQARDFFAQNTYKGNEYKHEWIDLIEARGEAVSIYWMGERGRDMPQTFVDICSGPHAESTGKVGAFKLLKTAGAYWHGDEKKKMLTRIYGTAFENQEELDQYLFRIEEAKKRDHRKLGKELDLFTFSELVGPGLPLWTPKGTALRHELDRFVWSLRSRHGYSRVCIPHITKKDLYERSGHWEKFANELFRIVTREGKEYAVKPMNCPHHTQIFARKPHSYREMPQRYAETTMVYRDEQSGELGGLTRVLSITQDDSHIFCRYGQIKQEFFAIWDIVDTLYTTFGFSLRVRLSFHDPATPEKYLGTPEIWLNAEKALREIAQERQADYFEAKGEAAMYGPKLDFMATDSIGRQHQVATIQLDMNLPERFDLSCINERGEKERIVMIHSAIMGSIERFSAVLIEHLGGVFPLWLAPEQIRVATVGVDFVSFARCLAQECEAVGMRVSVDDSDEKVGKKIRNAAEMKIPWTVVVGGKEVEGGPLHVRVFGQEEECVLSREEFMARLQMEGKPPGETGGEPPVC
ncbi:MAG TPA: threonine--tRNA ligase [Patescibacteria group bacterium]|nr:threonine--tRNA ligase [Patescibacteria group bacterium]